ncbi:MAG: hypothetical protein Q8Q88_19885 [Phenylobacterium sp.]|uniref:hypothetical protein n=1 Tax=Phenylobacterium sp. TaxID=1871053 RepID=UPI0027337CEB|nr:hypothetical protein [Phenylobacterium sp.]MDP3749303.1 hypothetical protein [Phenylobacterium sp.]
MTEDVARAVDAIARNGGGRAAFLRRLVEDAVAGQPTPPPARPATSPPPDGRTIRVGTLLTPEDADWIDQEAFAMGLHRSSWIAALVHRRASGGPRFSREGELAIIRTHTELRRISAALLRIAHQAGRPGSVEACDQPPRFEELAREVRAHIIGLEAGFVGNLSYWRTGE